MDWLANQPPQVASVSEVLKCGRGRDVTWGNSQQRNILEEWGEEKCTFWRSTLKRGDMATVSQRPTLKGRYTVPVNQPTIYREGTKYSHCEPTVYIKRTIHSHCQPTIYLEGTKYGHCEPTVYIKRTRHSHCQSTIYFQRTRYS